MNITNPKTLERSRQYITSIAAKDKVCILHDTDPDGVCSAVIISKTLERIRGSAANYPMALPIRQLNEKLVTAIQKINCTHLIITDFSADQYKNQLKELSKTIKILVIDHHTLYSSEIQKNITIYKPQLFCEINPGHYCTAKLAFDLVRPLTDVEDLSWICAVGMIADVATKPWQNWMEQTFLQHNIELKEDLFETQLGQVASTLNSTEVYNKKLANKCYELLHNSKRPKDILNCELAKYKKIIERQLNTHIQEFPKKAFKKKDLWIYEFHSEYGIQGPLSTLLGIKYPHTTIILINSNGNIKVSARRLDQKVAVGKLLEAATLGFEGANAGGYKHSGGARFAKKHLNEFKERVKKCSM